MDNRSYYLANSSQLYDDDVASLIAKMAMQLEVQLISQTFEQYDPITIMGFFPAFPMAFDMNFIHEQAAMWLFHFFMGKPDGPLSVVDRAWQAHIDPFRKKLASYCHVVNYLLNTCIIDDIVAEADGDSKSYKQSKERNDVDYSHSPWTTSLHFDHVY